MTVSALIPVSRPLPRDRAHEVALRAKAGDQRAFTTLLSSMQGMVYAVAQRWTWTGMDLEELVSAGSEGVFDALRIWNPERAAYTTLAHWHILAGIQRAVRESGRTWIDRSTGQRNVKLCLYLDEQGPEQDGPTWIEKLPAAADTEEEAIAAQDRGRAKALVADFLRLLSKPLERDVVHRRLLAEEPETLSQLGERHRLSRERVRQVEQRVKAVLERFVLRHRARVRAA